MTNALTIYMDYLNEDRVEEELRKMAPEGRLTCAVARKIAEDLGVQYKSVGEAANKLDIKITDCALGCF